MAARRASHLLKPAIQEAFRFKDNGDDNAAETTCLDVLEISPGETECLKLLADLRRVAHPRAAEALLRRAVTIDPDDWKATFDLAVLLVGFGNFVDAEIFARNTLRLAPENADSHNLMGLALTETNRTRAGEYHYQRAIDLSGQRKPSLVANLALNLKNQGKMAEARALYQEASDIDPNNTDVLLQFARLEEADRNLPAAAALLDRCERIDPRNPRAALQRAIVHGRTGSYDAAVSTFDALSRHRGESGLNPNELLEKGRLLDRMGRYEDAFHAFSEGKGLMRALSGQAYLADEAKRQVQSLKSFFTRSRLAILPRARAIAGPQPIFVVGFPRSGTTLVEQMLSAHSQISAGDELPFINRLTVVLPRLMASPLAYPEALAELWMGDHREDLDDLRDDYLRQARRCGVVKKGVGWFTDKMPLNETHLGLISLVFPEAPIIHVLRHPLDVVLSVFSNQLTHGFYCSYALETAAEHYALIFDLIEHYRANLTMNYFPVRYEDIVVDQRLHVQRMLRFIGEPFEEACLHFEENRRYARTASYAQVAEKLYDRSRYRFKNYLPHLAPILPLLEHAIEKMQYALD